MISLRVNGQQFELEVSPSTPLLWVLRDTLGLMGTKYGCGMALCGACLVHVGGVATPSCTLPVSSVADQHVTTIEGLGQGGLHPLQVAWLEEEVAQCGYCQPGQIMAAAALLSVKQDPTDADIDAAMSGNICRCGTYGRIRNAIKRASVIMRDPGKGQSNG